MRRHKLTLADLRIESFDTTTLERATAGTVHAYGTDGENTCLAVCTNAGCSDGCSGQLTCNAQTCAGQCTETGNDWTYPPHHTCDPYQETCADPCMW